MTDRGSLRRFVRHPATLLLAAVLVPGSISTLVVWWLLPDWWQLSAYFWYSIPGNSFVYFPHEPAVIYAGTLYAPALVAVIGGIATMLASIVDHAFFTQTFQLDRFASIKRTRVMRLAANLFNKRPWWTIVLFAFTPVPFYPIRVVAPMSNYPMQRYVSAVVVGRVPRYFLLALGGVWVDQLTWTFLQ